MNALILTTDQALKLTLQQLCAALRPPLKRQRVVCLAQEADVAVVGAGAAGLTAAHFAAAAGTKKVSRRAGRQATCCRLLPPGLPTKGSLLVDLTLRMD